MDNNFLDIIVYMVDYDNIGSNVYVLDYDNFVPMTSSMSGLMDHLLMMTMPYLELASDEVMICKTNHIGFKTYIEFWRMMASLSRLKKDVLAMSTPGV